MANNGNAIYVDGDKGIDLVTDVYNILGLHQKNYDLGYAYFNEHGHINQDSLIKPIYTADEPFIEVSDFVKYNFGYAFPCKPYNTFSELLNAANNDVWILNEPVKGKSYANLAHFNGYDHAAKFSGWGHISIEPNADREEAYLHISYGSEYSTAVCPEKFPVFRGWHYAYVLCKCVGDIIQPYYAGCCGTIGNSTTGEGTLHSIPTIPIETGNSYMAIHFICQNYFKEQSVIGLEIMPWHNGNILIPNFKETGYCISEIVNIESINREPNYTILLTTSVNKSGHTLNYSLSIINLNENANSINTGRIILTWYLTTDPMSLTGTTYRKRQIAQIILDSVIVQGSETIFVDSGQINYTPTKDEVFIQCEYSDSAIKPSNVPGESTMRWSIV